MTRCLLAPFALVATVGCASLVQAQQPQSAPPAQAPPATQTPRPQTSGPSTGQAPKPSAQTSRPAAPAAGGAQPTLLGKYGDWEAYSATTGGKKICFALAKPGKTTTVPPNRPRDPTYMFVSSRPAEKVKDELSVIFGYGFKPNSDATLEVAGATYAMYTKNDGAWIKNAAEEPRVVETLRKGADAVVKGVSARGTTSTDTYSLKGFAQALDRVGQECGR